MRPAGSQRAGFVEYHGIDAAGAFHYRSIFKPHAAPDCRAHARHNRGRRGQTQRAGAGHHQHRHRMHQRSNRAAAEQPGKRESQQRQRQYDGHKHRRHFVGQPRNRRFAALRFRQSSHHVAQQRVAAERFGAVFDAAGKQSARQHAAAGSFALRLALAGQMALVRPCLACQHHTVGSDAAAVGAAQHVAGFHGRQGLQVPSSVCGAYFGFGGRQPQQQTQAVQATALGALFQILAQRHKSHHHHAGFEIHRLMAAADQHHAQRIQVNRRRTHRHQHVHIRQPAAHAGARTAVKRQRQPQLNGTCRGKLVPQGRHQRMAARQHSQHTDHKRQCQNQQQPQPPMAFQAARAGSGVFAVFRLPFLRRQRAKACFGNHLGQDCGVGTVGIEADLRFLAGEIDCRLMHEIFFVQHLFQACRASLAGHALDAEGDAPFGHNASPNAVCGAGNPVIRHTLNPDSE